MTEHRDGVLEIGHQVLRIMESLEDQPDAVEAFLAGDGSLVITRAGVTYLGLEDRPRFEPAPMPGEPGDGAYFDGVRQSLSEFFSMVQADPGFKAQWLSARVRLVVSRHGFTLVEAPE